MLTRNRMSLCIQSLVLVEWDVVEANKSILAKSNWHNQRLCWLLRLHINWFWIELNKLFAVLNWNQLWSQKIWKWIGLGYSKSRFNFSSMFVHYVNVIIPSSALIIHSTKRIFDNLHLLLARMNLTKLTYSSVYHQETSLWDYRPTFNILQCANILTTSRIYFV